MRPLAHTSQTTEQCHVGYVGRRVTLDSIAKRRHFNGRHSGRKTYGIVRRDRVETEALKYDDLLDDQRRCIDTYLRFLLAENAKFNLTGFAARRRAAATTVGDVGLKQFEECVEQIVNDSAALIPLIDSHFDGRDILHVVDVGSGAGIPGIVFGILMPNWKV